MSEDAKNGSAMSLKVTGSWLIWTAVVSLMLLGFMFWLLYQWGGFDRRTTADGATLAAGVLGVVGTLLTASVTFVGLLLRLAQQERAIQIQADAEARTFQIQADAEVRHTEAEARLHMEAAIQAVGLMGDTTKDGMPVTNAQRAGAIYALANLGQMPLALVLVDQLWEEGKIDPTFGVLIVNDALEGDDVLQRRASRMLLDYAETLWSSGGLILWPTVARDWTSCKMTVITQHNLVQALLKALVSRPFVEWADATVQTVHVLYGMLAQPKTDPQVKHAAAMSLVHILHSRPIAIQRDSGEEFQSEELIGLATKVVESNIRPRSEIELAVTALKQHVAND